MLLQSDDIEIRQLEEEVEKLKEENKRYYEILEFAVNHLLLVSDIGQVEMVINQIKNTMDEIKQ